jgi:hypothetical protein
MSFSKKINLSPQNRAFIENLGKDTDLADDDQNSGPQWTITINAALTNLQHIIISALPDLDDQEWQTILNCYAGTFFDGTPHTPARIASDLMDNIGAESLDELQPEYRALVEKIHALSQAEQLAILYFSQAFWAKSWKGQPDFASIKKAVINNLAGR